MSHTAKYPLPPYLIGVWTQLKYSTWIRNSVGELLRRDRRQKRPFTKDCTDADYEQKLEEAVFAGGQYDPYTGQKLRWDLVGTMHASKKLRPGAYGSLNKAIYLMPAIDHKDPASPVLLLEICALIANGCKSCLSSQEFIAFCKSVTEYTGSKPSVARGAKEAFPCKTPFSACPPPAYLNGILTKFQYHKLLHSRADSLHRRDQKLKRRCAQRYSIADYKQKIHEAFVSGGQFDPYTGQALRYDLIGSWKNDSSAQKSLLRLARRCGVFNKEFYLYPVVDHLNPDSGVLQFQICSWLSNACKYCLTPAEFIDFCKSVAAYAG
ncbi:MAG: hypothetical protein PHC61_07830 [Chitinivibrionales bacterium]|nr:hypothetical protein [Chitinivibrionales bacterium]